jgi:serine/threonine protein kinase
MVNGNQFGVYVIESQLGVGGMGEVYRARDETLQRTVAIKVLLPAQDGDGNRHARFLQEARAASALNHPNIVTIYGVGTDEGRDYLVMEYITGKSLDDLIPRGGLRLNVAVRYGLQIVEAMCAAHKAGIVHRDLKPANVMVSESGVVKVLDFGLAKAMASPDNLNPEAPTMTAVTVRGSILGTAAYMSPEQAEGGDLDGRTDIFAFGCMFYEMLTGISPFKRDSVVSSLTAILRDEPKPLSQVTADLPGGAERIIQRCLKKQRERRVQSSADLKVMLEELKEESEAGIPAVNAPKRSTSKAKTEVSPKTSLKKVLWVSGAGVILLAFTSLILYLRGRSAAPGPQMTESLLASLPGTVSHPSLSPDGNQVAFVWDGGTGGPTQIYLKVVGTGDPLRLTNGTEYAGAPAWSPDGTSIAFLSSTYSNAGNKVSARREATPVTRAVVISALGGAEREIASYEAYPRDISWSVDGRSVLVSTDNAVYAISVASKERRRILDAPPNHVYRSATLSPDGRTLALIDSEGHYESRFETQIYLVDMDENGRARSAPRLLRVDQDGVNSLAWTTDSKALVLGGAKSLDTSSLWRVPINGAPETAIGNGGQGSLEPTIVGASRRHRGRMVYLRVIADTDIWKVPMENGKAGGAVPLIASTQREWDPRYSPDGKKIAFTSDRGGLTDIWVANADGYEVTQVTALKGNGTGGARWSPDGKQIAFISKVDGQWEIFIVDAQGGAPVRITNNPAHDTAPMWSPDGKWIYFASDRSGGFEIWKTPPNDNGKPVQVTHHGGYSAIFSADGKTMFYNKKEDAEGIWKQALVDGEPSAEESQVLPVHLTNWGNFDVGRDGIAYVPAEQGTKHIYFYRFADKSTTKLDTFTGEPHFGISISRVDGSIVFAQLTKPRRELVLVENFQ